MEIEIQNTIDLLDVEYMRNKVEQYREIMEQVNDQIVAGKTVAQACGLIGINVSQFSKYIALKHMLKSMDTADKLDGMSKNGRVKLLDVFAERGLSTKGGTQDTLVGLEDLMLSLAHLGTPKSYVLELTNLTEGELATYCDRNPSFKRRLEQAFRFRSTILKASQNIAESIEEGSLESSKFVIKQAIGGSRSKDPVAVNINIDLERDRIKDSGLNIEV